MLSKEIKKKVKVNENLTKKHTHKNKKQKPNEQIKTKTASKHTPVWVKEKVPESKLNQEMQEKRSKKD